jgi:hypothetical protein
MFAVFSRLLLIVAVAVAVTPAQAVVITIDDSTTDAGAFATTGGSWFLASNSPSTVAADYLYTTNANVGAVYNPSAMPGFAAGVYDVYATWARHDAHSDSADYTVNHTSGSAAFNITQTQNAAQGNIGSLPNGNYPKNGSGLRYLGTFSLDNSSTVVVNRNDTASTVALTADAIMIRFPSDGRIIDHQSSAVTSTGAPDLSAANSGPGTGVGQFGPAPSGNYAYWTINPASVVTWKPQYAGDGPYDLKISWQTNAGHSNDVAYLVDVDGVLSAGDSLFNINQTLDSAGLNAGGSYWSGFFDLGTHSLTSASQILQYNNTVTAWTAAPMLATLIPEPSSLALLTFGMISMWLFRRSRK